MSESLLTVLKFCFLALLYLFLARVVRIVALELRATKPLVELPVGKSTSGETSRRDARGSYTLCVIEPDSRKGETYAIVGELTVGRAGGCAIVLPDDTFISQVHARVFLRDGRVWVEDLGSTNGTFLNRERLTTPTRLRRGDRVQFGQTLMEVTR